MKSLILKFKSYFSLNEIHPDKKVLIVFFSSAVLLVLSKYYDGLREFNILLSNIFGEKIAEVYSDFLLIDNDVSFQLLLHWGINCIIVFLILPIIIVKLILKENLTDYGFNLNGISKHLWIYGLLIVFMLPVVFFVSSSPAFLNKYPFYSISSKTQLTRFFYWEMIYILQFISIEFFFRGFMLHGVKHKFGYYSILFAMIPYCMIHFGKPISETLGAIIAGCILGFLSLNTGSILLGILVHVTVAVAMDFCALWRNGLFN